MKLVITGGHLTPAYGFVEEAKAHHADISVIGALGKKSLEASEFVKLGVDYYSIYPVKYDRYHKLRSYLHLPLIVYPILQSLFLLLRLKPQNVLVFGSFNAVPVAVAAKILGIPVYLHEQTRSVGLANRFISRFAAGCAVSYPETLSSIACLNKLLTGNLIRHSLWNPPQAPSFTFSSAKPILFITGGNQGSVAILKTLEPLYPLLSQKYQLVIQYGNSSLPPQMSHLSLARKWFNPTDMSWLLSHCKFVIARGGANTTSEIMLLGVPSILIPLPHSAEDEQTQNAHFIADHHAGIMIPQAQLTSESLISAIHQMEQNYFSYKQAVDKLKSTQDPQAAAKLYQFVANPAKHVEE